MKFYGFIFMMKLGARILPKDFDIPDKKVTFQKFPLEVSGGFDSRYQNSTDIDFNKISRINKYIEIDSLLKTLEYYQNNNLKSIHLIEENSHLFNYSMATNIFTAGLLDDFNFEII